MNLFVGTSGYSYPKWKGSFYPAKLPQKHFLRYYGEHFGTVEVNYTFRTMPTPKLLEGWAAEVTDGFRFVLKAPQLITHIKRLKAAGDVVSTFFDTAAALKDRLGPVLFQLPPNFKKDVPRLRDFLAALPTTTRVAFEFRHQSWFDDEVFALLREFRTALCLAEAEDDLDTPFVSTTDWGYLRLRQPKYTAAALKKWVKRVREQEWKEAFVFFKHEDEGTGPRFAKQFLELAAKA